MQLHGQEIKRGDGVWHFVDGWQPVDDIVPEAEYGIVLGGVGYNKNGRSAQSNVKPLVFWNVFNIPDEAFNKPKRKVKKYLVLFKNGMNFYSTCGWEAGYFASEAEFKSCPGGEGREFVCLIKETETEEEV